MYRLVLNQGAEGSSEKIENEPIAVATGLWTPQAVQVGEIFEPTTSKPFTTEIFSIANGKAVYYTADQVTVVEVPLSDTVMGRCEQIWSELGRQSNDLALLKVITGVGLVAQIGGLVTQLGDSEKAILEEVQRSASPAAGGSSGFWNSNR